ncbi:putative polysaccharide biosynthesis protein [Paenibacillus antarcticus]|uniref:Uncharacterized protein n=1 Tax=Paenibacillus antarcticus TaxID=253703 RepID=A0A168LIN3_9BACL|nr:oligosaccharide flippase family protein [Paenibacillus antarcticus]OAB43442.1 hypothetical protein PBAT_18305 [Paenibacillus antarcticus]
MKDNVSVASRMLHGAFILTLATVLSKLIGTLQKIPLQNMGGDVVFGIYNTVYPFYSLVITLAIAGFPIAISKFVAENDVTSNDEENRRIIRLSSWFIGLLGVILGLCTYLGAPLIARWIDNTHVASAIRYVSVAFLFVPLMSLLRGFFQGHQNMVPTAISQIVEQSVRVTVMIVLLLYLTSREAGPEDIAAGALFGSAAGGAAGLLVMLFYWRRYRTRVNKRLIPVDAKTRRERVSNVEVAVAVNRLGDPIRSESSWMLLRKIAVYAIPICLASLALPLMNLVDTFTVPKLLKAGGIGDSGAMIQFGIYNRGMPLVQLITMLATSLSVLFIPALAEARFKSDTLLMQNQCRLALRWFWMMGLAASVGLCVLAEPINVMLYQDTAGTDTMRWIAFTAAFSSISLVSAALLQGIGIVKAPAVNLLVGALAKTLLNLWLVPKFGITGAAIAFVVAQLLAAALNVALLVRSAGLRLGVGALLLKPAIILVGLGSAAVGAQWAATTVFSALGLRAGRMVAVVESLSGVTAGAIVFVILVVLTKLIREEELRMLPKVGSGLTKLLQRLRVLR